MTTMGGLCEWVAAHATEFESVSERRNIDADMISRAQALVRAVIAEKRLIIYGGQAIDFALRARGGSIYTDDQIPDYDFFSDRHAEVAYELADRLVAEGFAGVDAIRAIHPQTMRVRVENIVVADVSYVPTSVFERLPTLTYTQGGVAMRVLHPDFQRTDMHLAFCFPFGNPPREDLFHRYAKDLKRFHMIQELYPVECTSLEAPPPGPARTKTAALGGGRVAVHGVAAYGLLAQALRDLVKAAGPAADTARAEAALKKAATVDVKVKKAGPEITLTSPEPLVLVTPWDGEIKKLAGKRAVKWRAPLMDGRPRCAVVAGGTEVFHTKNRLLVVVAMGGGVLMVTPQYLLLYFLLESLMGEGGAKRKKFMRGMYASTLGLLSAGGELLAAAGAGLPPAKFDALVECSPFGLPVRPLGDVNRSVAYLTNRADSSRALGEPSLPDTPDPSALPGLYFPKAGQNSRRPRFEAAGNPLFEKDGREL